MAARVQVLAAGQAPGAARRVAAGVADPEPGRVMPAVDAQLDGVRHQAGRGSRAPPGARDRGSGPVLAGRHARARCQILAEPCGETIAAWPAGQDRPLAVELACPRLTGAGRAGRADQAAAEAADAVYDGLLMAGIAGCRMWSWPRRRLPSGAAARRVPGRRSLLARRRAARRLPGMPPMTAVGPGRERARGAPAGVYARAAAAGACSTRAAGRPPARRAPPRRRRTEPRPAVAGWPGYGRGAMRLMVTSLWAGRGGGSGCRGWFHC
jgi:hypothetical protein